MPDLQKVQQDAPDVIEQFSSALGKLSTALGIVSKISSLLGLGDVVGQLLKTFIPGQPDPVTVALAAIGQKLDVVLHFEVADAEKEHMFQIEALTADARTNWRTLLEVNFDFSNPTVDVAAIDMNTSTAANELAQQDMYWLRPFYDGLTIVDSAGLSFFQGPTPPLDQSLGPGLPQVFDYRLTLPAFLYAVQIRCGFVFALNKARPESETDAIVARIRQAEVTAMESRLENVYATMVAGVVAVPVPQNDAELQAWDLNGRRMGVVDIYARLGNVEQFFDQGFILSDLARAVFRARLGLHNMQHWKNWYAHAGFGDVWDSLQAVRAILGSTTELFDKNAAWSLRDVAVALDSFQKVTPGIPLSVSSIVESIVLVGLPTTAATAAPILRPFSFRAALSAALAQQNFA